MKNDSCFTIQAVQPLPFFPECLSLRLPVSPGKGGVALFLSGLLLALFLFLPVLSPLPTHSLHPPLFSTLQGSPPPLPVSLFRGLSASLTDTAASAADYSDLFCLHADSGAGPVLECHHDDPATSDSGSSPSLLATGFSAPALHETSHAVFTTPSRRTPRPDLRATTPPPRGAFV